MAGYRVFGPAEAHPARLCGHEPAMWSMPVTAERSGARRLCEPFGAGAYDIFNENDLQYL
jgi:hypothetical protein